ncbi:MAG: hypothetical protein QM518_16050 [Verrucomicrobiota bacterium]|nr:hypothetical protein [Verrucomicrobiota bacterium]MDI9385806.1 hypothetical protein [Verrucomicrobiota bacterium]
MESLIGEWVSKDVSVMLRLGGGWAGGHKTSMLKGKLIQVGDSGVMLELPTGLKFVPVTAILHISLPE